MRVGINSGMGDDAGLPIFRMPDAAVGADHRTITSRSVPLLRPGSEELAQVASEPPHQARQGRRQPCQAAFPGAPCRKPSVFGQQRSQLCHDGGVLWQKGPQRPGGVQAATNQNHYGFDDQRLRIGRLPSALAVSGRRKRQGIDQAYQADKQALAAYPSQSLLGFELGTEMLRRRARAGKPGPRLSC
jgi:hypothetical protein